MPSPPATLTAPSKRSAVRLIDAAFGQCRFIVREGKDGAVCCGAPTAGGSWCPWHRQLVYVARRPEPQPRARGEARRS
jgi:hypothetical protein